MVMKILVTAGNTQVLIDKVRCLTNIFTGRTGAAIAAAAHDLGHHVTLLTSHPEAVKEFLSHPAAADGRLQLFGYRTFDDLDHLMSKEVANGRYDAVIHSAAVSDYLAAGVFAPGPGTHFAAEDATWHGNPPMLVDRRAGKIKSDAPELWLRLVRAPKLVDKVRTEWQFGGVLLKFKLEVGVSEDRLLQIAEQSRCQSDADLMVANTLEGAHEWAFLGPLNGTYERLSRRELPERLLAAVQQKHKDRTHG